MWYLGILYSRTSIMPFKSLIELFEYNTAKFSKKTLINSRIISAKGEIFDEKFSWNEVRDLSKRVAAALCKLGQATGSKVGIWAENSSRWVIADLAIMYLGASSLNIDPGDTELNAANALKQCDVNTIFIGDTKYLNKLIKIITDYQIRVRNIILMDFKTSSVKNESQNIQILTWDQILANETRSTAFNPQAYPIDSNFTANILMNSGAEGSTKIIPLSHKNIIANIESVAKYLKYKKSDVILSCHSLSDIFNKNFAFYSAIFSGACLFFPVDSKNYFYELAYKSITIASINPKAIAEIEEIMDYQIEKDKFTKFLMNIPIVNLFIKSNIRKQTARDLRLIISSGSYLPEHLFNTMKDYGFKILQSYGTTESSGPVAISKTSSPHGSVGKIIGTFDSRITSDGELEISGNAITSSYIANPALEAEVFYKVSGTDWFRTGDIVKNGANGELVYLGRLCEHVENSQEDEILLSKVEQYLRDIDYIDDVLIVGEGRPFVSALITIRDERFKKRFKRLDRYSIKQQCEKAIEIINKRLKNFERIRKFSILDLPLRSSKSELSANKKVRRKVVEARYHDVIESLYD